MRKVPGRAGQHREAAPHENCAPFKALFWLVLRAHKQTVLFIGPVTVTPLVVRHICFFFSTTLIKRVTYFACIHCCICCASVCWCLLYPSPPEKRITMISLGNSCVFTHICSDIVNMKSTCWCTTTFSGCERTESKVSCDAVFTGLLK